MSTNPIVAKNRTQRARGSARPIVSIGCNLVRPTVQISLLADPTTDEMVLLKLV